MASQSDLDIHCPVCLEVFKNPVLLSCSHSFCKACLQKWWTEKVTQECPKCRRRSSRSDPPCNLALKNLCEVLSNRVTVKDTSLQSKPLCPQHNRELELYCLDHHQPVCLVCRDSRLHDNHRFRPIDEAGQEYRELLRKSIQPLQDRLKDFSQANDHFIRTAEHIKKQGQHTEMMIQKEFQKMRAFLQKEEEARIRVLKSEVQLKTSLIEQKVATLSPEIEKLSECIRETEEELKAQDVPFSQNYSAAVKRVQQVPLKNVPVLSPGSLLDVTKHLGNMGFNIWTKMKELVSYTPVVLDPNTAHPSLVISDDLTTMHNARTGAALQEEPPWVPNNPERFNCYVTVLGSEGFSSGTKTWEVDVQNDAKWIIGVTLETVPRKKEIVMGYWGIGLENSEYRAISPPFEEKVLTLKRPPQKIRVDLDWDKGRFSFTDSQTGSHIYIFTHAFKEKVFPFINTSNPNHIQISPVDITVHPK